MSKNMPVVNTEIPPPLSCSREEYEELLSLASSMESSAEAESEFLECSRFGEVESVRALLEIWAPRVPNFVNVRNAAGSTALHFASANGHGTTVHLLLSAGALHVRNQSGGNTPLHWAAQNSHAHVIQLLLNHAPFRFHSRPNDTATSYEGIDVLEKNDAGRSALTEGFGSRNNNNNNSSASETAVVDSTEEDVHTALIGMLLEHDSATEDRLIGGDASSTMDVDEETAVDDAEDLDRMNGSVHTTASSSTCSSGSNGSGVVHEFNFLCPNQQTHDMAVPPQSTSVLIRELPIQNADSPFGTTAAQDSTGLGIWCASLVSARWFLHLAMQGRFDHKGILELGAGCGVPGLTVALYSRAYQVYLTDFHSATMKNLQYNIDLNSTRGDITDPQCCWTDRVRALQIDWADPLTWPTQPVDCILGSDLIYQKSIVPLLKNVVDGLLIQGGSFFYVCPSDGRDGLDEFITAMKTHGFSCVYQGIAPDEYRDNPLANKDEEEAFLHFYELPVTEYMLMEFVKQPK